MAVTGAALDEKHEDLAQIDRLVHSNLLHGSESLCKLLRYLAEHSLHTPNVNLKEHQIATEVFGRPMDFDPRLDSTVRVQTGRLRSKLSEYYATVGVADPIVVELPKGAYGVTFHRRVSIEAAPVPSPEIVRVRPWLTTSLVLSVALVATATTLVFMILANKRAAAVVTNQQAPAAFRSLWKSFLEGADQPWVVFSNAAFVGRPETGLRYFDPKTDTKQRILDHYTGVGEVLAVHELDRVFAQLNRPLRIKRGRLLSLDDAKNNNLIFVGSPSENLTLQHIPSTLDFNFERLESGPRKGDLVIVNHRPRAGEQKVYMTPSDSTFADDYDYAVVGLVKGMIPPRMAMILAGVTTMGTQAAAEYVCRPNAVEDLLQRLTGSKAGDVIPFEAVLRVKVVSGVPVETELVALHAMR